MSCENCEYYEPNEHFGICWHDPANPKEITQPDADTPCQYDTSEES